MRPTLTAATNARPEPAVAPALALEVRGVTRVYKAKPEPITALAGIDLEVPTGEFFGLLGPNGAGKTTLIKILTTLLLPTSGEARVFGFDVASQTKQVRRIMNMVAGGEQSGYGLLTVREQLWMFSQFYGLPVREGWRRVDELIVAVGMQDQREQKVSSLSTGQRQKMNLARGLLNDPWILFLDEPTLGLDVAAARAVRQLVSDWRAAVPGRTVLLTTHYMAEAEQLCDRVAIIDRGAVLACDSTPALRRQVQGGQHVELELAGERAPQTADLPGLKPVWGAPHPERATRTLKFRLPAERTLVEVLHALEEQGFRVDGIATRETTLEDVFIAIVGRGLEDTGPESAWDSAAEPETR